MDVTKRGRAEAALRSCEYFLARAQEVTQLGSYEFDAWTGPARRNRTRDRAVTTRARGIPIGVTNAKMGARKVTLLT
jgi:hypothetical protein